MLNNPYLVGGILAVLSISTILVIHPGMSTPKNAVGAVDREGVNPVVEVDNRLTQRVAFREKADSFQVELESKEQQHIRRLKTKDADLTKEIAILSDEIRQIRSELDRNRDSSDSSVSQEMAQMSADEIADAAKARNEAYVAKLDNVLAEESVDTAQQMDLEADVSEIFSEIAPDAAIGATTCGATICRMEILHDDPDGHEKLLNSLTNNLPWDGPGFILRNEQDDQEGTLVYLGKPGTELPEFDASVPEPF